MLKRSLKPTKKEVYFAMSKVTGKRLHVCYNETKNEILIACDRFRTPIYI